MEGGRGGGDKGEGGQRQADSTCSAQSAQCMYENHHQDMENSFSIKYSIYTQYTLHMHAIGTYCYLFTPKQGECICSFSILVIVKYIIHILLVHSGILYVHCTV